MTYLERASGSGDDSEAAHIVVPSHGWETHEDALVYIKRLAAACDTQLQQDLVYSYAWFTILTVAGFKMLSAVRNNTPIQAQEQRFLRRVSDRPDSRTYTHPKQYMFALRPEYAGDVQEIFENAATHMRQCMNDADTNGSLDEEYYQPGTGFQSIFSFILHEYLTRDESTSLSSVKAMLQEAADAFDTLSSTVSEFSPVVINDCMPALVDCMEYAEIPKSAIGEIGSSVLSTAYRNPGTE